MNMNVPNHQIWKKCRRRDCHNEKSYVKGHYGRCLACHEASERERLAKEERRVARIHRREQEIHRQEVMAERRRAREAESRRRTQMRLERRNRQDRVKEQKTQRAALLKEKRVKKVTDELTAVLRRYGLGSSERDGALWDYDASQTDRGQEIIKILEERIHSILHPSEPTGEHQCPVCFTRTDILLHCNHPLCDKCMSQILNSGSLYDTCPSCRAPLIQQDIES